MEAFADDFPPIPSEMDVSPETGVPVSSPATYSGQEAILGTGYCMKSTIANAAISASHETRSFPESGINMQAGSSSVKARVFMKTSRVSHSSAVPDICSMP